MAKHDETKVIRSLAKKNVIVNSITKVISIKNANNLGNSSWGKIDFLLHYCDYIMGDNTLITVNPKIKGISAKEENLKIKGISAKEEKTKIKKIKTNNLLKPQKTIKIKINKMK